MPEKKMWRNTAVNIRGDEGCEVTVQNMSDECIEVKLQLTLSAPCDLSVSKVRTL